MLLIYHHRLSGVELYLRPCPKKVYRKLPSTKTIKTYRRCVKVHKNYKFIWRFLICFLTRKALFAFLKNCPTPYIFIRKIPRIAPNPMFSYGKCKQGARTLFYHRKTNEKPPYDSISLCITSHEFKPSGNENEASDWSRFLIPEWGVTIVGSASLG